MKSLGIETQEGHMQKRRIDKSAQRNALRTRRLEESRTQILQMYGIPIPQEKPMKEFSLQNLIEEFHEELSDEVLRERLALTTNFTREVEKVNSLDSDSQLFLVRFLTSCINNRDTKITSYALQSLASLSVCSPEIIKMIETNGAIYNATQTTIDKDLIIPCLLFLGNLASIPVHGAVEVLPNALRFCVQFNDRNIFRLASWALCIAADAGSNVSELASYFLKIQDEEVVENTLRGCLGLLTHDYLIPFQQVVPFIDTTQFRDLVIEILSEAAYKGILTDDISQVFRMLLKYPLTPLEIKNVVWAIGNIVITKPQIVLFFSEGDFYKYVIKQAYLTDVGIKRECCKAIASIINECKTEVKCLKMLVENGIVNAIMDLLDNYEILQKGEMVDIIKSLILLMEQEKYGVGAGQYIQLKLDTINKISFDKNSSSQVVKFIMWLLNNYFE
ncbi:hypothetical protein EIN_253590 [Entamoeba invadens IP1]|uniref:Importin subunit alpha n=1 Tax=Entamoeba invadens IP1 TaxID=370355 RepID=A0A0A1UEU0_ENTIV|nr:hypothetical protein EIN_253590 [Entamoeba invadens IP1]ELP95085.1 hypothetical protein EIN_253590 [Entamoeba invadens IP1]|eukprot:XP_004261856.1 hypothetical protein EIN_253590 [Entamoeba invadens IP1]